MTDLASGAAVAVITRTRDRPLLLPRAIASVAAQSFTDYVHVIVNDGGSAADVENALRASGASRARIAIITIPTSSGLEAASNAGIAQCRSEFVAIHDDDDSWHPDFLKRTVEVLRRTSAAGVMTSMDCVIEELVDGAIVETGRTRFGPDLKDVSLLRQLENNELTPIGFLFRRDAYEAVGRFDESLPVIGDWEFGIRFLRQFDVEYLAHEPRLAHYHHRPAVLQGPLGNSVFARRAAHDHCTTALRNRLLREDLDAGRFGLGSLMALQHQILANRDLLRTLTEDRAHQIESIRQELLAEIRSKPGVAARVVRRLRRMGGGE